MNQQQIIEELQTCPNGQKVRRKDSGDEESYSYIKIEGEVYKIDKDSDLKLKGEGIFGRVKRAQCLTGPKTDEWMVVKIADDSPARGMGKIELSYNKQFGLFCGSAARKYGGTNSRYPSGRKQYLVMPDLGQDFSAYIRENILSKSEQYIFALQMIGEIERLHKVNLVHSDIKPENFVVDEKLRIRLLDFGLTVREGSKVIGVTPKYHHPVAWIYFKNGTKAIATKANDWFAFAKTLQYFCPSNPGLFKCAQLLICSLDYNPGTGKLEKSPANSVAILKQGIIEGVEAAVKAEAEVAPLLVALAAAPPEPELSSDAAATGASPEPEAEPAAPAPAHS